MQKRQFIAFCILVAVSLTFLAVAAVNANPQYPALTAPYECTLTDNKLNTVTIEAGPDGIDFPYDVPCPDGSGICSAYKYRWTYEGITNSHAFVSVASDIAIFATDPAASVEDPPDSGDSLTALGVNLFEQRTTRFNANASTFEATITTTRSAPRVSTAGVQGGRFTAYCLIAGPGIVGVNPNQSIPVSESEKAGGCVITYRKNPAGHIVPGSMQIDVSQSDEDCAVIRNGDDIPGNLTINGQGAKWGDGTATTGSGTCYQWFSNNKWYAVSDVVPDDCP